MFGDPSRAYSQSISLDGAPSLGAGNRTCDQGLSALETESGCGCLVRTERCSSTDFKPKKNCRLKLLEMAFHHKREALWEWNQNRAKDAEIEEREKGD